MDDNHEFDTCGWVLKTKQLMNERVASLDSDVSNEVNLVHQNWF